MTPDDAPPAGIEVERFGARLGSAPAGGGYRDVPAAAHAGVRVTYTPGRSEVPWVAATFFGGAALCGAFVWWLVASSGDERFEARTLPTLATFGVVLAAAIALPILALRRRRRIGRAELEPHVLRTASGVVVTHRRALSFRVDRRVPTGAAALDGGGWSVVVERDGQGIVVLGDLPTEAHAAYVCAVLTREQTPGPRSRA